MSNRPRNAKARLRVENRVASDVGSGSDWRPSEADGPLLPPRSEPYCRVSRREVGNAMGCLLVGTSLWSERRMNYLPATGQNVSLLAAVVRGVRKGPRWRRQPLKSSLADSAEA